VFPQWPPAVLVRRHSQQLLFVHSPCSVQSGDQGCSRFLSLPDSYQISCTFINEAPCSPPAVRSVHNFQAPCLVTWLSFFATWHTETRKSAFGIRKRDEKVNCGACDATSSRPWLSLPPLLCAPSLGGHPAGFLTPAQLPCITHNSPAWRGQRAARPRRAGAAAGPGGPPSRHTLSALYGARPLVVLTCIRCR